jgi:hypothetical protein
MTDATITVLPCHIAQYKALPKRTPGHLHCLLITKEGEGYLAVSTDGNQLTRIPIDVEGGPIEDLTLRFNTLPRKAETLTVPIQIHAGNDRLDTIAAVAVAKSKSGAERSLIVQVSVKPTYPDWRAIYRSLPQDTIEVGLNPELLIGIAQALLEGDNSLGLRLRIQVREGQATLSPIQVAALPEGLREQGGSPCAILMPMRVG